ncbi:MAG: histidine phosphatase family protein [Coriobacteriia bacterium]|nr:histidine phosphatase family protein [Coriobacteriia bacterium]
MADTTILIIRHPETEANVAGRFVGRGTSPFTAEGELQARRLSAVIARFAPASVWSSPLERALVVASDAAKLTGVPLRRDDRLMEIDFGLAEGKTYAEIEAAGLKFNYRSMDEPVAPEGESRHSLGRRVASIATELVENGNRVAIVTHAGVFRVLLVQLLGLCADDIWAFQIHNAQVATVRIIDGHGMLVEFVRA